MEMEIKHKAVEKALSMLDIVGAKYHVSFGGVVYGEEIATQRRAPSQFPYGTLSNAIKPYLSVLEVGQVAQIPIGEDFDKNRFQSTCCSIAYQMWGSDSYTSMLKEDGSEVQILRLA